jgi:hypothetical protein
VNLLTQSSCFRLVDVKLMQTLSSFLPTVCMSICMSKRLGLKLCLCVTGILILVTGAQPHGASKVVPRP